jgi:UDP-2,3-diacylglucosamine hydrolase
VTAEPRKLAIFAGGGSLPLKVAEACAGAGRPYAFFDVEGAADPEIAARAAGRIAYATFGHTLELLKREGCAEIIMVGRVKRPDFRSLIPDWRTVKILPRIVAAARGGDDALLKAVAAEFESEGIRLVGVDEIAADLIAPEGPLGQVTPNERALADMARARALVAALGPFDVGQGAIVCEGLVLAVEAAEGTDAMLARCAALPEALRGTPAARRGVLVKQPKPGQERKIDLPTIGLPTVEGAAAAGLAGIAIEAGGALVLDRAALVARADACGLFVHGFSRNAP